MAQPIIRPMYDPHFDPGVPAIVTFWAAFIGQRQSTFDATMKSRLEQADNSALAKELQIINEGITEIIGQRARLTREGHLGFSGLVDNVVSGEAQMASTYTASQADIIIAEIGHETSMIELRSDEKKILNEAYAGAGDAAGTMAALQADLKAVRPETDGSDRNIRERLIQTAREEVMAGITPGSPEHAARDAMMANYIKGAADDKDGNPGVIQDLNNYQREYLGGKTSEQFMDARFPPISDAEAARRSPPHRGVGGPHLSLWNLMMPGAGTGYQQGGAGGAGGAGGQQGPTGSGGYQQGSGTSGGYGEAGGQRDGMTRSRMSIAREEWMKDYDGDREQMDAQLAAYQLDADRVRREMAANRAQGSEGPFAGYQGNYLLNTQNVQSARGTRGRLGRLQERVDTLASMDPRVRAETGDYLRAGGSVKRAAQLAHDDYYMEEDYPASLPTPGQDLRQAGDQEPGGLVYSWLADVLVDAASSDEEEDMLFGLDNAAQTIELLAGMDPDVGVQLGAAWQSLQQGDLFAKQVMGAPVIYTDPNKDYRYKQDADGSVWFVGLDADGRATANEWTRATGGAVVKIQNKTSMTTHPSLLPEAERRSALAKHVGEAARSVGWLARAGDIYAAELIAGSLEAAGDIRDTEQALVRYNAIGEAAYSLPLELSGGFGTATAEAIKWRGDDVDALRKDGDTLAVRGRGLADTERTTVTQEVRDAFADKEDAARVKRLDGAVGSFVGPALDGDIDKATEGVPSKAGGVNGEGVRDSRGSRDAKVDAAQADADARRDAQRATLLAKAQELAEKLPDGDDKDHAIAVVADKIAQFNEDIAERRGGGSDGGIIDRAAAAYHDAVALKGSLPSDDVDGNEAANEQILRLAAEHQALLHGTAGLAGTNRPGPVRTRAYSGDLAREHGGMSDNEVGELVEIDRILAEARAIPTTKERRAMRRARPDLEESMMMFDTGRPLTTKERRAMRRARPDLEKSTMMFNDPLLEAAGNRSLTDIKVDEAQARAEAIRQRDEALRDAQAAYREASSRRAAIPADDLAAREKANAEMLQLAARVERIERGDNSQNWVRASSDTNTHPVEAAPAD